jgi:hypothetical protein
MLDILFSFQFVWIALLIVISSTALAYLCALLHKQLLYITVGEWLMEHIYCPLLKVLQLLFIAFLLFPLIEESISYGSLARLFTDVEFLQNLVNVLFITSLLLVLIPILNHPAIAMPVLGSIAIALIYLHQMVIPLGLDISLLPSIATSLKIIGFMLFSYWLSRWLINHISETLDYRFNVTGSQELVSDTSYLILQIPVILAFGQDLHLKISV